MVGVVLKNVWGWKIYNPPPAYKNSQEEREKERDMEERQRGREGDVGVRLLTHSEMMGNYISNYRWEQERTP